MRRNVRPRSNDSYFKKITIWSGVVLLLAIITFAITYAIYSNKVKNEARVSQINSRTIGELVPNVSDEEEVQSASSSIGKSINEVLDGIDTQKEENTINNEIEKENRNNKTDEIIEESSQNVNTDEFNESEEKHEISFKRPIEGEILREFAKEKLVYSNTLKEWVTHFGIDIKAMKTSVVKSAEAGIVKSIKNDPRYGITVTVEHENGFKTVYANLLTAEFVSEGENIKQGQSIGTVGSSANFEIADETHLHFEIWKDGEALDPEIYLK